jgi:phage FluMu protein gp41
VDAKRGVEVIPDTDILERRIAAMKDIPWPIAALVVVEFREEDLDRLDAVADTDRYWTVLNEIVTRIQKGRQRE